MGEWHMIWVYHSEKKRKTQFANALTDLLQVCAHETDVEGNLGVLVFGPAFEMVQPNHFTV